MPKVEEVEEIGSTYAKKLVKAGIKTTDNLHTASATPKGRENLVKSALY